ncbi:MAG: diguanylate cyclase, partial [Bdellovibrionota bacterium]
GSRNGTFVNDEVIGTARKELEKEDMIKIGSTILKFLPAGQLETLYHINLTNAASMDKLTSLYNRKYINEVLDAEFKRAKALHSELAVALFDIDNFKKINDTHGHPCGDFVLSTLGTTVKGSGLRERDLAGRWGGEEFIIVMSSTGGAQAMEVAERVRKKIETHEFIYEGKKIPVTVSMGVAFLKKDYHEGNDIYKAADKALYESKHNGKNCTTLAAD